MTDTTLSVVMVLDASQVVQVVLNGEEILINNDCPQAGDCEIDSVAGACAPSPRRGQGTIRPSDRDDPFVQTVEATAYDETQSVLLHPGRNDLRVKVLAGPVQPLEFWLAFRDSAATDGSASFIASPNLRIELRICQPVYADDVNGDRSQDISDPIGVLNFLFASQAVRACFMDPDSPSRLTPVGERMLDFNRDGSVNVADPVAYLNFLFSDLPFVFGAPGCVCVNDEACEAACSVF